MLSEHVFNLSHRASRVAAICNASHPIRHFSGDRTGKNRVGVVTSFESKESALLPRSLLLHPLPPPALHAPQPTALRPHIHQQREGAAGGRPPRPPHQPRSGSGGGGGARGQRRVRAVRHRHQSTGHPPNVVSQQLSRPEERRGNRRQRHGRTGAYKAGDRRARHRRGRGVRR